MRRYLLLTFALFVVKISAAQNKNIEKISVHFEMWKHPNVTYTIDFKKNNMHSFVLLYGNDGDTIYNKRVNFKKEQVAKFREEISKDVPETVLKITEPSTDGGGFTLTYFKPDGKTSQLILANARRNMEKFRLPLTKIEAFFKFAYSVTWDDKGRDLLDASYNPYYTGVPVRKISNSPLEYKIWGSLSGNASSNPELIKFIESLPKDKCVIIDCNNKLSYALQEDLLRLYIITGSKIRFVNNDYYEHTRNYLLEIREKLKDNKTDKTLLERDSAYVLYKSNPEGFDKWLALPEKAWNPSLKDARKGCK